MFLVDIYPAREKPIPGVTSKLILEAARQAGLKKSTHVESLEVLSETIVNGRKQGDIIITFGAGSITEAAPRILRNLH